MWQDDLCERNGWTFRILSRRYVVDDTGDETDGWWVCACEAWPDGGTVTEVEYRVAGKITRRPTADDLWDAFNRGLHQIK